MTINRSVKLCVAVLSAAFVVAVNGQDGTTAGRQSPVSDSPIDTSKYLLTRFYSNDFSRPQKFVYERDLVEKGADGDLKRRAKPDADAEWIVEGNGGVDIRGGVMRASPLPFDRDGNRIAGERSHLVIWNRTIFPADFLLEWDMSPNNSTNGLTIIFVCATSKTGGDIFDLSLPPRGANYPTYHSGEIMNYSDSYWSRNTLEESLTNRFRKNPGFELVAEGKSLTTGSPAVTHHLRLLKVGGHLEMEVNGKVIWKWDDPGKPLGAGRLGFRSMDGVSMITYDNVRVSRVRQK